jgi:hypothetical protein
MATVWSPAVLLVFAGVLAFAPFSWEVPVSRATPVDPQHTDLTSVRQPQVEPSYALGAFTFRCSDCHKVIPSPAETERALTQHREVHLQHGLNTRCFNCHHRANRDAFVDDSGREISLDRPELLCAKCHGPAYRDWQRGAHGRTNGYWDAREGRQVRASCTECHDPHRPAFGPLAPAPGPSRLRGGERNSSLHGDVPPPLRPNGRPQQAGTRPGPEM